MATHFLCDVVLLLGEVYKPYPQLSCDQWL